MTTAEIIKGLKAVRTIHNGNYAPFIDGAIKKLKDRDCVLDKIRAEIREEMLSHSGTGEEVIQAYADGLKKGLKIIDKYKAESEGSNADSN